MARRGARALQDGTGRSATDVWRQPASRAGGEEGTWQPEEVWIDEGVVGATSGDDAVRGQGRGANPRRMVGRNHRHSVPLPVVNELAEMAGKARGTRLAARLADATHAYDRERYQEARRILRGLAGEVPTSAAVQELYGLALYRSGQWAAGAAHLERYRTLSGDYDQHPVLADSYRALRRYDEAERLWDDLREASPDADLVAEGRIVAAGVRADQGDLAGAVAILERSLRRVDRPQERHLRQWYVLADLTERAGDLPRARTIFAKVAAVEADAYDVADRLRALR
ncbi:MAG: tetratricopeptide repeat protein [Actinomycetota bacterium]|nr:tetratricopeptide repeat protein [Actinomycetota bacterium]